MPLNPPSRRDIENRIFLRAGGEYIPLTDLVSISGFRILVSAGIVDEYVPLWAAVVQLYRDTLVGTAKGAALDRRLADFDLLRPGAVAAVGVATVTVSAQSTVRAGSQLRSADGSKKYAVLPNPEAADGSWTIEAQGDVGIQATVAGRVGNAAANTITAFDSNTPANLVSVTNQSPLTNGVDGATDSEFREFFIGYLASLKGSTRGALFAAVSGFTDAATGKRVHSMALEEWDGATPIADVDATNPNEPNPRHYALRIWIDEGLGAGGAGGATADSFLVDAVQRFVDGSGTEADPGHRDAGIPTIVKAALALGIGVDVRVDVDKAYAAPQVAAAVENAILAHLGSIPVAGRNIRGETQGQFSLPKLNRAVLNVPGVLDATFISPRTDRTIPTGYKVVATSVTVITRVVES